MAYMAHRNEEIYSEPEQFRPERFINNQQQGVSDDYGAGYHPFAHVAFSAGPRNCIGQKFAILEIKCTLSHLLRNFELLPVDGFEPQLKINVILNSSNGIRVRLRARKQIINKE